MFQFMVNADGGLTTAGYAVCIAVGGRCSVLRSFLQEKALKRRKCLLNSLYSAPWRWRLPLLRLT